MHPINMIFDDDDHLCNHVLSIGFETKEAGLVFHFQHIAID